MSRVTGIVAGVLLTSLTLAGCAGVEFINPNEQPCKEFYALAAKNPPTTGEEVEDRRNNVLRIKNTGERATDPKVKQASQAFYDAYISQDPTLISNATTQMLDVCP
jgi:hypothetical protein